MFLRGLYDGLLYFGLDLAHDLLMQRGRHRGFQFLPELAHHAQLFQIRPAGRALGQMCVQFFLFLLGQRMVNRSRTKFFVSCTIIFIHGLPASLLLV